MRSSSKKFCRYADKVSIRTCIIWSNYKACNGKKISTVFGLWWNIITNCRQPRSGLHVKFCKDVFLSLMTLDIYIPFLLNWFMNFCDFFLQMRAAVRNAAKCFPTAIISGRSRDKVSRAASLTFLSCCSKHFVVHGICFQMFKLSSDRLCYYAILSGVWICRTDWTLLCG